MKSIDPQGEIVLTLPDDTENPTRFVFRPWTVREMRAFSSGTERKEISTTELVDFLLSQLNAGLVRTENPAAYDLESLSFTEMNSLLTERYRACFVSPDDKKKSES